MLNTIEEKMEIAEQFSAEKIVVKVFKLLRLAVLKSRVCFGVIMTNNDKFFDTLDD